MQLKNQKLDSSSINNISTPKDLSEEPLILENQTSNYLEPAIEGNTDISSPHRPRRFPKLGLAIGLPVFFIIGLGVILFPSFADCSSKAREAEGRNNIGTINRGEEAYYLKNNKFSNSIPELGIGISLESVNYQYSLQVNRQFVVSYAQSKSSKTKSYLGVTFVGSSQSDRSPMLNTIVCEVDKSQSLATMTPIYQNGTVSCPQGTKDLTY